MEIITLFLGKWLELFTFNQDSIHNFALIYIYMRLLSIPLIAIYLKRKDSEKLSLSEVNIMKNTSKVFIANFLLCSLFLIFMESKFLINWYPTGWRFDTIKLLIIFILSICSFLFYFRFQYRHKERSLISGIRGFSKLAVIEFVLFSAILIFTNGLGKMSTFVLDSAVIISEVNSRPVAILKTEKSTSNGQSNGISNNIISFMISAVDVRSGERIWSDQVDWQEYLLGNTSKGLFVVNGKKETLFFLDVNTGKKVFTEDDLVKEIPGLADNLSYNESDYVIGSPTEIYFYGLDGFYYKIDLSTKEVTKNAAYQDVFSKHHSSWMYEGLGNFDDFEDYYPELMEVYFAKIDVGKNKQLITNQQKRNNENRSLALISTSEHHFFWNVSLNDSIDGIGLKSDGYTSSAFYEEGAYIYTWTGKYQYKIRKNDGKIIYQYNYGIGRQTNIIE